MADKRQENLPGYPHYPEKDDITNPDNSNDQLNIDEQGVIKPEIPISEPNDDIEMVMGTEADVTPEERQMLEAVDGYSKTDNADENNELLNEDNDNAGEDLDVPGSELDDANEDIGEEDEENNYYSGSDKDIEE